MHKYMPNFKPVLKGLAMKYCTCLGLTEFVKLCPGAIVLFHIYSSHSTNYGATTFT